MNPQTQGIVQRSKGRVGPPPFGQATGPVGCLQRIGIIPIYPNGHNSNYKYPLVICYITMERSTIFQWENQLFLNGHVQ